MYEVVILFDGDDNAPMHIVNQPYTLLDLIHIIAWAFDQGHGLLITMRK